MSGQYKVVFRTWNVMEYYVNGNDEDDAIEEAEKDLLIDLVHGEEYEVMDVYCYTETSRDEE